MRGWTEGAAPWNNEEHMEEQDGRRNISRKRSDICVGHSLTDCLPRKMKL